MADFIATLSYELHRETDPDAAKLLRAELVGRRWQDRYDGQRMPAGTLWIRRSTEPGQSTDDVHAACVRDLHAAAESVAKMGRKVAILRAWIQVTGAGTWGLVAGLRPKDEAR